MTKSLVAATKNPVQHDARAIAPGEGGGPDPKRQGKQNYNRQSAVVATPCAPLCARRAARAQWGVGTAMLVATALCDALGRLFTSTGADGPRVRGQLGFAECLANVLH
jgi:hypothetical protein